MKVKELIEILSKEDPEAGVEFVYYGNHFQVNGCIPYNYIGWNAVELFGNPMHSIDIQYNKEEK